MCMRRLAGALAAACTLLLVAGCGSGNGTATAGGEPRGLPSCGEQELDAPPDAAIDWTHYVRWNDRMYAAKFEPQTGFEPGQQLGAVECTRASSRTPVEHTPRHAEAAFLPTGTPVRSVKGQPVEDAITAEWDGRAWLFRFDAAATQRLAQPG